MLKISKDKKDMASVAKKTDIVTVYGTGKSNFLKEGKAYQVHRLVGEKLVKAGKATSTKVATKAPTKDK